MIILVDLQPNAATPAVTDLLVEALPTSHLNLNNRDRFRVLCDKEFTLDNYVNINTATQAQASTTNQVKNVKKYLRLKGQETIYNAGTAGTIADITSGALYMFWIGNIAAGANADANAVVSTRVRFVDA